MKVFGVVLLMSFFCLAGSFEIYGQIDTTIYKEVPQMPRFSGCENTDKTGSQKRYCAEKKLREFVEKSILYPARAKTNLIEGEVILSFVVEKDGSLSNIAVTSSLGSGCDEEAIRLAKQFPNWVPGRKKGKKVRVLSYAVIDFVIPSEEPEGKKKKKKKKVKESQSMGARKVVAKNRIDRLMDGVLVVRLNIGKNKISTLQRLVANASTDEFSVETQETLDRTIFLRDSINQELVSNFSQEAYYNFSEVLFMLESDKEKLASGEQSGYFLNKNMELDPSISLDGRTYLTTYLGTTPRADGARAVHTAFVTIDEFGYPFSMPFPSYVEWRKRLFSKKDRNIEAKHFFSNLSARDAVIKFNKKLSSFYENSRTW